MGHQKQGQGCTGGSLVETKLLLSSTQRTSSLRGITMASSFVCYSLSKTLPLDSLSLVEFRFRRKLRDFQV